MEFSGLGSHCSVSHCRQKDFLPFVCSKCKECFCLDHRSCSDHECGDGYIENVMPKCEKCCLYVHLRAAENPVEILKQHLASGCKNFLLDLEPEKKEPNCSLQGCSKSEVSPIQCKKCGMDFCILHRHAEEHKCTAKELVQNKKKTGAQILAEAKKKTNVDPLVEKKVQRKPRNPKSLKNEAFLNKVKLKFKAVGNERVKPCDRCFFEVFIDSAISHISPKSGSVAYWFDKNLAVSRAVDDFCSFMKIANRNNETTARKIVLMKNGEVPFLLDQEKPLADFLTSSEVYEGEKLLLCFKR